jgi:hypothetical protein
MASASAPVVDTGKEKKKKTKIKEPGFTFNLLKEKEVSFEAEICLLNDFHA